MLLKNWILIGAVAILGTVLALPLFAKNAANSACNACSYVNADDCPDVVIVEPGGQLQLTGFDSGQAASLAGRLDADLGRISGTTYIAPSYIPEGGLDQITVRDASGVSHARILIQVQGIPINPPSPDDLTTAPVDAPEINALIVANTDDAAVASDIVIEELEMIDLDSASPALEDVTNLPSITIGSVTGQDLPLRPLDMETYSAAPISVQVLLVAQAQRQKGRKCGVHPKPGWINDPCTNGGKRAVNGPWKKYKRPPLQNVNVSVDLSAWGFGIGVMVSYLKCPAEAVRYTDYYKCVNGHWVYSHSVECVLSGAYAQSFDPNPGGVVPGALGYSGDPGWKFNHGSPECTRL